ncbi:hypothetical protein ACH5RR_004946 [Cinchona calisaya]|uniref:DEX1 C-terminal domain-containing protein n=1 Tax=Cinchona calisaya TaxID=153742 RepID=A0ABD3AYY8_9GENT
MPNNLNDTSWGSELEKVNNGENGNDRVDTATVENGERLDAEADSSFELFRESDDLADEYNYDYDGYVDESLWGDEEWSETHHETLENYVHIDAHVLCSPVIEDIDNDGISEMVVAVSHFFDHEYSMVLADNVDGGDDLDLIVTTMNGNVFCFSNPASHHPLRGRNNVAYHYNREGINVKPSSRAFRDEEGKSLWVETDCKLAGSGNYVGEWTIKQKHVFDSAGVHRIKLPTVRLRTSGTVLVEMVDKNGLHFSYDFALTFHMHYYKLLKWLQVLPMLRPQEGMLLPLFSRNTNL